MNKCRVAKETQRDGHLCGKIGSDDVTSVSGETISVYGLKTHVDMNMNPAGGLKAGWAQCAMLRQTYRVSSTIKLRRDKKMKNSKAAKRTKVSYCAWVVCG